MAKNTDEKQNIQDAIKSFGSKSFSDAGINLFLGCSKDNTLKVEGSRTNMIWLDGSHGQDFREIANIDASKISRTRYYGRKTLCHSAFIFGYNEIGIYQVDFLRSGKLGIINVPYEELLEAFFSPELPPIFRNEKNMKVDYNVTLIEPRDNIKVDLNSEIIKFWLEEYLQARTIQMHNNYFVQDENTVSGIKVYECMIALIDKMKADKNIDYRMFHALYEHKKLMVNRIEELIKQGIIVDAEELLAEAQYVRKLAEICRMLILKYNVMPKDEELSDVKNTLRKIRDKDMVLLNKLIERL